MPRESIEAKTKRTRQIIRSLREAYPDAHCELDHRNPLQLLVATILSAQCTDKRVNMVTPALFHKYPTSHALANAPTEDLEQLIKTTGFFRNKARSIKACCATLVQKHQGEVPSSMEDLTALGGVGRKTANVVLGNAFGKNCGVVVDTHVGRLSLRLGLTKERGPEKVEQDLMALVPQDEWTLFSHLLIWHGRRRCYARNPDCPACEVNGLCPRVGVETGAKPKAKE